MFVLILLKIMFLGFIFCVIVNVLVMYGFFNVVCVDLIVIVKLVFFVIIVSFLLMFFVYLLLFVIVLI